jgi:hypothetical protein
MSNRALPSKVTPICNRHLHFYFGSCVLSSSLGATYPSLHLLGAKLSRCKESTMKCCLLATAVLAAASTTRALIAAADFTKLCAGVVDYEWAPLVSTSVVYECVMCHVRSMQTPRSRHYAELLTCVCDRSLQTKEV